VERTAASPRCDNPDQELSTNAHEHEIGVPCDTMQVENAQPYQAIIAAASDRGCDLIAMASHGRGGLSAVVLGSVTNKVLAHTKIPVLVYR
jgi:nucleotide-binding universal stress UspA family protein